MPHITIECSANVGRDLDLDDLVRVVHQAALGHPLASPDALRTRLVVRDHYQVGPGDRDDFGFVAISVRVGPGRDDATKKSFIDTILTAAEQSAAAMAKESAEQPQAGIAKESAEQPQAGIAKESAEQPQAAIANKTAIMWSIELGEIDAAMRVNRNGVRAVLAAEAGPDESAGVDRVMPVRTRVDDGGSD